MKNPTILRNVSSNWVGYFVGAFVTLLLTPVVLRHLGPSGYGFWVLASSVIGYYGLLDFGFRAGVTQYLTRSFAVGDSGSASALMSTALAVLVPFGTFLVGVSWVVATIVSRQVEDTTYSVDEVYWCVFTVGVTSALGFALAPFMAVFAAKHRFDISNLIGVLFRIVNATFVVLALEGELGLIGVALATCASTAAEYAVRVNIAKRLMPEVHISRAHFDTAKLREIGSFGGWSFLGSINAFAYQHAPNLVIAMVSPIAAVGHYSLGVGLIRQLYGMVYPIAQVLYPAAIALHARGATAELQRIYHGGTRLSLLMAVGVSIVAAIWAEDFFTLWVGADYVDGERFTSVALLFQVLLFSALAACYASTGWQILSGSGNVRAVSVTMLCSSIVSVTVMLSVVGKYGLLGVAASTVLSSLLVDIVAMPILVQKMVGLRAVDFLLGALPRPLLALAFQLPVAWTVHEFGPVGGWLELVCSAGLAVGSIACISLFVGMSQAERERFLWSSLRAVFSMARAKPAVRRE